MGVTCRKAHNQILDVLELLNVGEPVLSERRDGDVLVVQTDRRTVGIGPDGTFSVLHGREFAYSVVAADHPDCATCRT